jgi:hypothetical protein
MTRSPITIAAGLLVMILTPAAQAYEIDPGPQTYFSALSQTIVAMQATTELDGVCNITITPVIAAIFALPDDWQIDDAATRTTVACMGDK